VYIYDLYIVMTVADEPTRFSLQVICVCVCVCERERERVFGWVCVCVYI